MDENNHDIGIMMSQQIVTILTPIIENMATSCERMNQDLDRMVEQQRREKTMMRKMNMRKAIVSQIIKNLSNQFTIE